MRPNERRTNTMRRLELTLEIKLEQIDPSEFCCILERRIRRNEGKSSDRSLRKKERTKMPIKRLWRSEKTFAPEAAMCNISRKDGEKEREREEREEQEREGMACWLASGFGDRCEREANCSASGAEGTQQGRAGDRFNIFSEELIPFHEVV